MKKILYTMLIFCLAVVLNAQDKKESDKKDEKKEVSSKNLPEGYGQVKWGTDLSKVKPAISGRLVYTDEKKVIISRDGELEYFYGFFYIDPATGKKEDLNKDEKKGEKEVQDEGKLFYIAMRFPYLNYEEVRKKLEAKYGPATSEVIKDKQGAVGWNSDKTSIIMWVDRYENRAFCRRITYISMDIAKELNKYQTTIFNKTEIDIIQKLNP